jgi:hypothetical protein
MDAYSPVGLSHLIRSVLSISGEQGEMIFF